MPTSLMQILSKAGINHYMLQLISRLSAMKNSWMKLKRTLTRWGARIWLGPWWSSSSFHPLPLCWVIPALSMFPQV